MSSLKLQIGPADHGRRMTLDEFRDAEEEPGYHYELARGVLEVTEFPVTPHRRIVSNLLSLAANYDREHPGVIDYFGGGTEAPIWKAGMELARHPDFGIIFVGAPLDDEGEPQPGLVVEVVSPNSKNRDCQEKRQDYLIYGIREYWIVDPLMRQVTILVRQSEGADATWAEHVARQAEPIDSPLLPGLGVTVADLWAGVVPPNP